MLPFALLVLCNALSANAKVHHALAEDPFAFPKYRVTFLNSLPVLNETAERWLKHGLSGGELEFLGQPWQSAYEPASTAPKGIESGDTSNSAVGTEHARKPALTLHHMRLSPISSYLCLVPPPIDSIAREPEEDLKREVTPSQSWSLLQPLSGSCLYHRQGWFTYAYCHNYRVRQFREMAHSRPHTRGHFEPEEDPVWEAYTLGQVASGPEAVQELTNAQEAAISNNVDIAKTAGHRYLVQRWGDGTPCDKTGQPREIEVQFHCSMTMADTILFVKETKTCHYVMVINTPRLCGEPGFKNRMEQRDEAFIRCREVLDSVDAINAIDRSLPDTSHPLWHVRSKPALTVPPPPAPEVDDDASAPGKNKKTADLIRRAFEILTAGGDIPSGEESAVRIKKGGDGEIWVEFLDADIDLEAIEEDIEDLLTSGPEKLQAILQGADDVDDDKRGEGERRKRDKSSQKTRGDHDEL